MSVLPNSATFRSFFVVLAIFLLSTLCIGFYLSTLLATVLPPLLRPPLALTRRLKRSLQSSTYIQNYIDLLNPSRAVKFDWPPKPTWISHLGILSWLCVDKACLCIWWLFRKLPANFVHYVFVREILFPRDQYVLFQYLGNPILGLRWHPLAFIRDFIRLMLLPVWVALVGGIVICLVVQDVVAGFLGLVWKVVCCWR